MRVTRGDSRGSAQHPVERPVTLGSMPAPLTSLPISSTSNTSMSSIGSRGRSVRA